MCIGPLDCFETTVLHKKKKKKKDDDYLHSDEQLYEN